MRYRQAVYVSEGAIFNAGVTLNFPWNAGSADIMPDNANPELFGKLLKDINSVGCSLQSGEDSAEFSLDKRIQL